MNNTETQNAVVMTKIKVARKITDVNELLDCAEFAKIFAGYENNICYEKTALLSQTKFIAAYIIPAKLNNSKWDKIYKHYVTDGTHFLGEIRLGSCLDNTPFSEWTEDDNGDLLFFRRNWDKCEANRKLFRMNKTQVTTLH